VGDIYGDGKLDLLVANTQVNILRNLGATFNISPTVWAPASDANSLAVGDLNGDGKLDFALANGTAVEVFLNDGKGGFDAGRTYLTDGEPQGVVIADFNGDGKLDLAVALPNDNAVSVFLNDGGGTFVSSTIYDAGGFYEPLALAVGDFDGDGRTDLAVVSANGPSGGAVTVLIKFRATAAFRPKSAPTRAAP